MYDAPLNPTRVETMDETVALFRESRDARLRAQASPRDATSPAEGRNS